MAPIRSRLGVSLFVDGLVEQTTYQQIRETFSKFGTILGVFVQRTKKRQRNCKFGFVRYKFEGDAMMALRRLDGKPMNGAPMMITKARYLKSPVSRMSNLVRNLSGSSVVVPRKTSKKVWVIKQRHISQSESASACDMIFNSSEEDRQGVSRTLIATLRGVQNLQSVDEFLISKGIQGVNLISLGAKEVALEFKDKALMESFWVREGLVLGRNFELFQKAPIHFVPTRHFSGLD